MSEIYLNGTTLSENDRLCLKDFFDKIEKISDIELIDTVAFIMEEDGEKLFTTWITLSNVPCSCSILVSNDGKCRMHIAYISYNTEKKINMEYCGNAGYTAGTFFLRTKLWSLRNRETLKIQKLPRAKNDRWYADQEKTVI